MTIRTLIGTTTLVLGLLPLAALAQTEETNGVVVEESQPDSTRNALDTLEGIRETAPEEAWLGLDTAIQAISENSDDDETLVDQQALDTLERVREDAPEEALFGLDTAIQAVGEGGVDGQTTSSTASEGRSSEAGSMGATASEGRGNAGGMGSSAGGGNAGGGAGGAGGGAGGGRN